MLLFSLKADFGVSAKNTKTLQRRDSFIGTPYWWGRCPRIKHEFISLIHAGVVEFSVFRSLSLSPILQDGSRGGDVRNIEGQAIWLQGWYLVPGCYTDRASPNRAAQPRDEPNACAAEDRQGRPTHSHAALQMVRQWKADTTERSHDNHMIKNYRSQILKVVTLG